MTSLKQVVKQTVNGVSVSIADPHEPLVRFAERIYTKSEAVAMLQRMGLTEHEALQYVRTKITYCGGGL